MADVVHLTDGRALGYSEWGARDGFPVLGFLGTSLSWLAHLGSDAPRAAGVRLLLVDRPGYGLSDFQPGRTLLDWPRDVAELADGLGIDRFAVLGMSGGGPHAAACGFALADRVTTLGLVSSPGPVWDRPELRFSAPPHRRPMIELAEQEPELVARQLLDDCRAELERIAEGSRDGEDGPDADRAVMADPDVRARFEAAKLALVARGPDGYARDLLLLYIAPWGFRPEDIAVPTEIWQGDADEAVSPRVAAFFADSIRDSRLHLVPGAGHLLLWSHGEAVLTSLKPT